jgi:hypothetical protein
VHKSAAAVLLLILTFAGSAPAQEDNTDPDRPDVTNTAHLIPRGQIQIEFGGIYTRETTRQRVAGSPLTVRLGAGNWLEARVGADSVLTRLSGDAAATGFGNLQLGAKVRLFDVGDEAVAVAILPSVTLPTANADNGIGSGAVDVSTTLLASADLGSRGHIDANYGVNSLGGGQRQPRYAQHLLSASLGTSFGPHWNPYFEIFWLSRTEAGGAPETSLDTGLLYALSPRFGIDGGVQFGIAGNAPDFAVFAGFSLRLGSKRGWKAVSG